MDILLKIISAGIIVSAFIGVIILILSAIQDIRTAKPAKRTSRLVKRLHITILILLRPNSSIDSLNSCLQAIKNNRYKNFDVVVAVHPRINKRLLAKSAVKFKKQAIKFYHMRKNHKEHHALYEAYSRSQKGDAVVAISENMLICQDFLRNTALELNSSKLNTALKIPYRNYQDIRILTLADKLNELSLRVVKKAQVLVFQEVNSLKVGYVFPKNYITIKPKKIKYQISNDTTHSLQNPLNYKKGSLWMRKFGGFIFLLVSFIAIFAAMTFITNKPFLIIYILFSFWALAVVWLDDLSDLRERVAISLALPSLYFFVLSTTLINFLLRWR